MGLSLRQAERRHYDSLTPHLGGYWAKRREGQYPCSFYGLRKICVNQLCTVGRCAVFLQRKAETNINKINILK